MPDAKSTTFEGIMRDLRAGRYAPIYYLMGDEPYYIDIISNYIADNALPEEERDFNQTIMFGSEATMPQIIDNAKRYPMMSERTVLIVKEAQNIKNTDALASYLKHPQMSTVLVFCHKNGSLDKRKKLDAEIARVGVLFESKKLRDRELLSFIERYLREKNCSIDPKSIQLIADSVGTDLSRLVGELEKLLLFLPENNRRVTPEVVERQIGVSKDFNSFELREAIVTKNILKANQIIKYFDENPKAGSIYSFLPMLFNYFQNLIIAYYCPQRTNQEAVAKWLDLRSGWAAKDYITGMSNYPAMKVVHILEQIRTTDAKSKGINNPGTPPGDLMKELLFFIFH